MIWITEDIPVSFINLLQQKRDFETRTRRFCEGLSGGRLAIKRNKKSMNILRFIWNELKIRSPFPASIVPSVEFNFDPSFPDNQMQAISSIGFVNNLTYTVCVLHLSRHIIFTRGKFMIAFYWLKLTNPTYTFLCSGSEIPERSPMEGIPRSIVALYYNFYKCSANSVHLYRISV